LKEKKKETKGERQRKQEIKKVQKKESDGWLFLNIFGVPY
jgi:hypothetical protein